MTTDDIAPGALLGGSLCFGCGAANPSGLGLAFEQDGTGLLGRFAPSVRHVGLPGHLHGGITATALDEVMAAACFVSDHIPRLTAVLTVRYHRPIALDAGELLVTTERVTPIGQARERLRGRLSLPNGQVAAVAEGLFVRARDGMLTSDGR